MKKTASSWIAVLTLVFAAASAQAEQWQIVGPRALGMGGAHVAIVNDATAQYWNPGAFGFFDEPLPGKTEKKQELREKINREKDQETTAEIQKGAQKASEGEEEIREDWNGHSERYFGIHLNAGVGLQNLGDAVNEVDDIVDRDFENIFDKAKDDSKPLTVADLGDAFDIINDLNDLEDPDTGVIALANAGFGVRIGHFGVGAYVLGEIATNFDVDLNNLGFSGADLSNAIDALSSEVLPGGPIGDTPGGLSSAQRQSLLNTVDSLPGWSTAEAQLYVDASDLAIAGDGRTATEEDIATLEQLAKIASDIESGNISGNLDNNQTSIIYIGPAILEIPLTYGYAINDYWSLGGNIKYMYGRIFFNKINVFKIDTDDFLADAYDESDDSHYFGIDLGTLVRFSDFRIGITGRNLNEPRFDYTTDEGEEKTWTINPQVRGGIAYMPCNWFTLAADADLTRNKSPKEGYHSQLVSTGVEFNLFNFLTLRGGFYTNVGDSTTHDEFVYTAGLGTNFWGIHLDVGAAMSDSRSEFNDYSIPDETRAELALSAQF
jgi:hypothetical protein